MKCFPTQSIIKWKQLSEKDICTWYVGIKILDPKYVSKRDTGL